MAVFYLDFAESLQFGVFAEHIGHEYIERSGLSFDGILVDIEVLHVGELEKLEDHF